MPAIPASGRSTKREPKPERAIPTCPAHLNPTAKAEWKRLAQEIYRLGIITILDRSVLAAYRQAYGRWAEAEKKLKETPALIKLPSGYLQQNPWLTIANKQLELMQRFMSELGLSPVARTRVEIKPLHLRKPWETDEPNPFTALMGKKEDEFFGWAERN